MKVIAFFALFAVVAVAVAVPIQSAEEQQKALLSADSDAKADVASPSFLERAKRFLFFGFYPVAPVVYTTPVVKTVVAAPTVVKTVVPKVVTYSVPTYQVQYQVAAPIVTKTVVAAPAVVTKTVVASPGATVVEESADATSNDEE